MRILEEIGGVVMRLLLFFYLFLPEDEGSSLPKGREIVRLEVLELLLLFVKFLPEDEGSSLARWRGSS